MIRKSACLAAVLAAIAAAFPAAASPTPGYGNAYANGHCKHGDGLCDFTKSFAIIAD